MKIKYYDDYLSPKISAYLLKKARPAFDIKDLVLVGESGGLESKESFNFLINIYNEVKLDLKSVLDQRQKDRRFIDSKTKSCQVFNKNLKIDLLSRDYKTILGEKDSHGRIVAGPHSSDYVKSNGKPVATIPDYLEGHHVTLFGPPDNEKMCINAMNAFHRKLKDEPAIIEELLKDITYTPKWGADNEDSKTPMHSDLINAGVNLSKSLDHDFEFTDSKGKHYKLADDHLSHAIKRFPGLALPSFFLFHHQAPVPLHIYDFTLHAFKNWHNKEALVFYVPKLENEEEAAYIHKLVKTTEQNLKELHPEYVLGTIRLMIVLENPRAVFRVNEIMDALHPYFVGASLGWHDYLGSAARMFKNDPNYRIPVKADPDIVIKYIKASHHLLSDVVGERGGIKVGGMYGILPTSSDLSSLSMQVTIHGYIRDVITQLKRNLNGFWVAHPDFVRIGMALVEAWKKYEQKDFSYLENLVKQLLDEKYHKEILDFILGPDIEGLDQSDSMYARSLIVADVGESNIIANNHPDEIRYNVFQSLQYLTDWLTGNGCVALPTSINDVPVRIMDDLATAERSRWEVWAEIFHKRFDLYEFLKITHEELHFIRKDLSDEKKIVQVKWNKQNAKWYPVAMMIMQKLMTDDNPAEFAPELLLPFTIDTVREAEDPWEFACSLDPEKFLLKDEVLRFNYFFERCGQLQFAKEQSFGLVPNLVNIKDSIHNFSVSEINEAANFHGDIGQGLKTLDKLAAAEQASIGGDQLVKQQLLGLGDKYREKFGFKYLVSAKGKTGEQMLGDLQLRIKNNLDQEISNARTALFEITEKRIISEPLNELDQKFEELRDQLNVPGLSISTTLDGSTFQNSCFGKRDKKSPVDQNTWFQLASLSKTIGTSLALDFFESKKISIYTCVNDLLNKYNSELSFSFELKILHLMNHSALNMHYVNPIDLSEGKPNPLELLKGSKKYNYEKAKVINMPGTKFHYSGAGFILLEHLLELISGKKFESLLEDYLKKLGINNIGTTPGENWATGFTDTKGPVPGGRYHFPYIAAGMMGSPEGMLTFLSKLHHSHKNVNTYAPLGHNTAVRMLAGTNLGSREFMNCDMGLGVFTAQAGDNKFMIHQGANDGYRSLFLYCYYGPDESKGLTIFSNAEIGGVLLNSYVAQLILKEMNISGIDFSKFHDQFKTDNIKHEEIVNAGYKKLVFDAFIPQKAEVLTSAIKAPLSDYNILIGTKIISVSNDKFACAENLISATIPFFDPEAYGKQGKIMDSWESERHNPFTNEFLHLKLDSPESVDCAYLSTKFHDGNQVEFVRVEALIKNKWEEILPQTKMEGHSYRKVKLAKAYSDITELKVQTFPDGGFTRLGLYHNLPAAAAEEFLPLESSECKRFLDAIPAPQKPLKLSYRPSEIQIKENFSKLEIGETFDAASIAYGGKVLRASNEHYGPADGVISPYGAIDMFDGLESARSRNVDNFEEVEIQLAMEIVVERVILDFTYFVNNNPRQIEIFAFSTGKWQELVGKNEVKQFRGSLKSYDIHLKEKVGRIKLRVYPDGGLNRIHVLTIKN